MRLSEQAIRKIPMPAAGYTLVTDGEPAGFGIRVTAAGARSFVLTYTVSGQQRRLTIGAWPTWSTTAAREKARELRRQIDQDQDPLAKKQARRAELTFREIAAIYMEGWGSKKRSGYRDREYLERDAYPAWGNRKAEDIKRRDVLALLDAKAIDAPIGANRLLACLRKVFNFAISRVHLPPLPF